uniref:Uncharacterized protein n=1 Tax=Oryza sativa subsp. japonica TaxID=39947 RepID=Q75KL1_ORYSJ|nr:unknown protein [Oryza sativa Japonica Group]
MAPAAAEQELLLHLKLAFLAREPPACVLSLARIIAEAELSSDIVIDGLYEEFGQFMSSKSNNSSLNRTEKIYKEISFISPTSALFGHQVYSYLSLFFHTQKFSLGSVALSSSFFIPSFADCFDFDKNSKNEIEWIKISQQFWRSRKIRPHLTERIDSVIVRARYYASSTKLPDLVGGSAPSWYGHETVRHGPTAPLVG